MEVDVDAGEPQPPVIPNDKRCHSCTSDSRLPMDIANEFGLILGFLNLGL